MIRPALLLLSLLLSALTGPNAAAAATMTLDGQWRFALDRTDAGLTENWPTKILPDTIQLPGILESQGYGDAISTETPWVLSLYDHFWYLRANYSAYTNAGSVKVPFICQPVRHYLGAAWYQRDFEVPASWNGQHVTLFLERPHWKSTVWLDGREIGSDLSLCTPHEFDFGRLAAGRHHLTIRVDNRMILPYRPDAHSISDSLDNAWNGIVGKIELRATAPVWIAELQVFPHAAGKSITVRGKLGNVSSLNGTNQIVFAVTPYDFTASPQIIATTQIPVSWDMAGGSFETEIALPADAGLWDEFHPTLYRVVASLENQDNAATAFGLRDLGAGPHEFRLNGHPIYLRGTHFGGDFPLTGYPPTDVASWKKIFQTCQEWGLNHMRFHSWCPPEAAFTAADELGFYLQVECGMWNSFTVGGLIEKMLYSETDRIVRDYGNHPSLLMVSASNEASTHWREVLPLWVKHYRTADPRHLYTPCTGWLTIDSPTQPLDGGADYLVCGRLGTGRCRGETGWFGRDYRNSLQGLGVPMVAHELGQWVAYPDFDLIQKFTGFMQPGNYQIFRDSAAAHGLLAQNHEFALASGHFQTACYKEEIEANLRTPGLAGFQLLDLHDYTGQGTALVGLLDPFWQSKGYVTPAEFKKYCNTVVPLARLQPRVFTTADAFEVPVEAANFSSGPLTNAIMSWTIADATGHPVAQGSGTPTTLPLGKGFDLGTITANLAKLPAPAQYKLCVTLATADASFTNDWNFWLYPPQISTTPAPDILVTSSWDAAEKQLATGGKVLFAPRQADLAWDSPPLARLPVFWNALMGPTWTRCLGLWCDPSHPALAGFPTEVSCDWQWSDLLNHARAINLDHLPRDLKPIVSAIDDWNRNYKLGVIFEARVGRGKLLVSAIDLDARPEAQALRRSLLDYMGGNRFQPATEVSTAALRGLFFDNLVMHKLGATVTANGAPADELVDGDPNTFWCSADAKGNGPKPPHVIGVHFAQPVAMTGLVLMPRQNQREHQGDIREYQLDASDDGTHWQAVTRGQLPSTYDPQTIVFGQTLTTSHLKLTALSGFGRDQSAGLAEISILYAGPKLPENQSDIEYQHVRTASTDIDAGGDAPAKKKK